MDRIEVMRALEVFCPDDRLFEIRAMHVTRKQDIWSGYFKDHQLACDAVQRFDAEYNIYFVFNSISEMCYSMAQKDKMLLGAESTKDTDIVCRDWVLIDLDPVRGHKKISSSNAEWQAARTKAGQVWKFLRDNGFSFPVVCSSGNGLHLMYKVDSWANTPENDKIVSDFLKALALLFTDDNVDIDVKVGNAARITKLYGTVARKGANDQDRPHRLSKILTVPDEIKPTDKELFLKVNKILPVEEKPTYSNRFNQETFNIDDFINKHGIQVYRDTSVAGLRKIILKECPFDPSHKAPDSAIFVSPSGAIGFTCFHNSCSSYTWKDLRLKYEPDAYDKKDYREFVHKQQYYGHVQREEFKPREETEDKGKKWLSMRDIKFYDPSKVISIPTGFLDLDKAITGLILGEVSLVSGVNGSGKSSWLNVVMMNAVQRGFNVALWSGELVDFKLKGWLDQVAAGKNHVVKNTSYDNVYYTPRNISEKISEWMENKFFLYNNNYGCKWEQIVHDVKDVVTNKGVKLVVIDNLMALDIDGLDGDKYGKQKKFIIDICDMAKQMNIHVILVAHPRKETTLLRKESISGTADLTNAVDNCFLVHRVGEDFVRRASEFFGKEKTLRYAEYSNVIEVCKNRSMGVVDYLVGMYYEVESRRFKNSRAEYIVYGWQEQPKQTELFKRIEPDRSFDINPFEDDSEKAPF